MLNGKFIVFLAAVHAERSQNVDPIEDWFDFGILEDLIKHKMTAWVIFHSLKTADSLMKYYCQSSDFNIARKKNQYVPISKSYFLLLFILPSTFSSDLLKIKIARNFRSTSSQSPTKKKYSPRSTFHPQDLH